MPIENKINMPCPICGEYIFVNADFGDYCPHCGWIFDQQDIDFPNEIHSINQISLNDYAKNFQHKISENSNYDFDNEKKPSPKKHLCPVCSKHEFSDVSSFEICPICGWEDDELMEKNPDKWAGSANDLCLNDFIQRYNNYIAADPKYTYHKSGFLTKK